MFGMTTVMQNMQLFLMQKLKCGANFGPPEMHLFPSAPYVFSLVSGKLGAACPRQHFLVASISLSTGGRVQRTTWS